ncbi:MAG: protein kinase [Gemmataceae bacterium]
MSILSQLGSLALRGAAQAAGHAVGWATAGPAVESTVLFLTDRFRDHSTELTTALERASANSWRSMEVALAGRGWWDRCKLALASGDSQALRTQVDAFLQAHPLDGVGGFGPDFRGQCLAQLHAARKAGLLDRGRLDSQDLARRLGDLSRFGDPTALVHAEFRVLDEIAEGLRREGYDALAAFLALRPAEGPPLLVAALRFFFQRELERNPRLFQGLAYARLDSLAEGQRLGFAGLAEALDRHGAQLESLLREMQAVVVETHANVLDIKSELARQGQQMQELGQAVLQALAQHQLERRSLRSGDSLSIRDEQERRLVRELVQRYRALPASERGQMPALLNAVGKLEVVAGNFEEAERDFQELAAMVPDQAARAEAAHNAYLAALERRAWPEALEFCRQASRLDPARFAPFPPEKFEPERILGAGGFGVAFLCRNRHSGGRVVIKTLRRETLDRDMNDVFREAQALEDLDHPAIIRVRDCDYADALRARPYLVMDYFPGSSLAEVVEQQGPMRPTDLLSLAQVVASGLQRAHASGILHRDVKPGNVLVRRGEGGQGWEVKLIDFGLALRAGKAASTARASLDRTLIGSSIAGTLDYAAPEQLGKVKGVAVGPYSDVYGFGKLCCFALFGTSQPTFQHWQKISTPLADLLGRCLAEQPGERPQTFTAVLADLAQIASGKVAPSQPLPRPKPPAPVEPIEEVVPVVPVPASKPRPRMRRVEHETAVAETTGSDSGMAWVVLLGVFLVMAVAGAGFFFIGARQTAITPPIPPRPPIVLKDPDPPLVPLPISSLDMPAVVAELKQKPNEQRVEALALRLAVTDPTEAMKKKRQATLALEQLGKNAPATKVAEARQADDILQVSLALEPLLRSPSFTARMRSVQALQKWGTSDNVPELIQMLQGKADGGMLNFHSEVARTLAAIGDPRGIPPLVARLTADRSPAVLDAVATFGVRAEPELLRALNSSVALGTRENCSRALEKVGTEKSLPALRKIASDQKALSTTRKVAEQAIQAITARSTGKTKAS